MGTEEGLTKLLKEQEKIDQSMKKFRLGKRKELNEVVEGFVTGIKHLTALYYPQELVQSGRNDYSPKGQRTILSITPVIPGQITKEIIFDAGWIQQAPLGCSVRAYTNLEEEFRNDKNELFYAKRPLGERTDAYQLEVMQEGQVMITYKFDRDEKRDEEEVRIFELPF